MRSWVLRWKMKCLQELTCREFEDRYEMKMMMMLMKNCEELTVNTELLPQHCLARNQLRLTITNRLDGYDSQTVEQQIYHYLSKPLTLYEICAWIFAKRTHGRNHWGRGSGPPQHLDGLPNFLRIFSWIQCDYVTDCTKLGKPVSFFSVEG